MKSSHTHRGHCQICGRLQAAHNVSNRLAKHGYTVDFGFFNGVCPGADHLPFEKSCDLIPPIAANLNQSAHILESEAAEILEFKSGTFKTSLFLLAAATADVDLQKTADGKFNRIAYKYRDAWQKKAGAPRVVESEVDAVQYVANKGGNYAKEFAYQICEKEFEGRATYAAKQLQRQAQQTRDFAAMLIAKVATFIPDAPLVPVTK